MLSNRPYLLRAFYHWITDSGCTPILVIDTTKARCNVPEQYIEQGEIVFNVSSTAVRDLKITNSSVEFQASFSGVVYMVFAPIKAVLAIYAEENNEGLFFDAEEDAEEDAGEEGAHNSDGSLMHMSALKGAATSEGTQKSVTVESEQTSIETPSPKQSKPFLKLVE